jgi:hypothetical protein
MVPPDDPDHPNNSPGHDELDAQSTGNYPPDRPPADHQPLQLVPG